MNKNIFLFVPLFFLYCCSSKQADNSLSCIQIVDRNGISETISTDSKLEAYKNVDFTQPQPYEKVLRIYQKDDKASNFSILTSYHANSMPWKYLEIRDARAFGKYKEWYENGSLKLVANIIGGSADLNSQESWLFDGIAKVYDQNQNILSEIPYQKGVLEGDAKYYYPNGNIQKIIPYVNNEIHGQLIEYRENDGLLSKTTYLNGEKEGSCIGYWSSDNIAYIEDYENNLLVNAQYFKKNKVRVSKIKNREGQKAIFKNGILYQLIEYKNGAPEGLTKTYNTNQQLLSQHYVKDGQKQGDEIQYYLKQEVTFTPNNKHNKNFSKLMIQWQDGNIHGTVKTWYKNAQLESQKEMSYNKKNGMSCAWYENGSIMFIEEYENDLITKGTYYQKDKKEPVSSIINGNGLATLYDQKGIFLKKITYQNARPQE